MTPGSEAWQKKLKRMCKYLFSQLTRWGTPKTQPLCLARGQENTNIHSYFIVFGPFRKKYEESSPVKTVVVGKFGRFLRQQVREK